MSDKRPVGDQLEAPQAFLPDKLWKFCYTLFAILFKSKNEMQKLLYQDAAAGGETLSMSAIENLG